MILSRSTSMMFLAAVGMNTVLGLPILNEQNLQSSPPAPDVQNVQAPAVQEISKRMDGDPNRLLPLEPKWSPSGPPNPRLSSTIPVTGTAYKRPLPAQDLPPGAYPPAFGWTGGRVFKIKPDYKKKLQVVSSKQIENLEIEEKMEFLNNCYEDQIARCIQQEHQCGDDDQKMREIRQEREEIKNFQRRVRDLGNKLNKSMEEDNFITNDDFIKNMKVLNALVLLYNDDGYKKVKAQIEWIQERLHNIRNGKEKGRVEAAMKRLLDKMPSYGSEMYKLGLAGNDYFGVSFLSEAYFEVKQ
ncbi:hypothetical protein EV360DRAFT_87601 [Lentinula raphanica]|nr:hypothetical protein EV360DRAFT_87601 [Lentinula raphanica]